MSHFSVLVVGENPRKQLAPYHEFECTGDVDEYVKTIDETKEAREAYLKDTESVVVEALSGAFVSIFDDRFYREPTPLELEEIPSYKFDYSKGREAPRIYERPENILEVPSNEMYNFSDWCLSYYERPTLPPGKEPYLHGEHKWGWIEVDVKGTVIKVIDRTNPNHKWDWYCVGGRFRGSLELHSGAKVDECFWGEVRNKGDYMPFAILKDGTWYEKGSMGWFACVSEEKEDWKEIAQGVLGAIKPDERVTLFDCHI